MMNDQQIFLKPLAENNYVDFINLLQQRGETPIDYYRWKYLTPCNKSLLHGFIAYSGDKCVGCIGVLPRKWRDGSGCCYNATWFADWFVAPFARGLGVGTKLIQAVANLSPYGMGIPGTPSAQITALKAGYRAVPNVAETVIPLRPFNYGWKRGGGRLWKRIFRGLRASVYSIQTVRHNITIKSLTLSFPEPIEWAFQSEKSLKNKPHLIRSPEYLGWLDKMPFSSKSDRVWWHVLSNNFGAFGFIETDIWGLRRSRILDYYSFSVTQSSAPWIELLNAHHEQQVDYVVVFGVPKPVSIGIMKRIPFFTLNQAFATNVNNLDRENCWRDLYL